MKQLNYRDIKHTTRHAGKTITIEKKDLLNSLYTKCVELGLDHKVLFIDGSCALRAKGTDRASQSKVLELGLFKPTGLRIVGGTRKRRSKKYK